MMPPFEFAALAFPAFDPVIFRLGPLEPRWYGLGYVVGILFAWWYGKKLLQKATLWRDQVVPMIPIKLDDFVIWSVVAVVVGGRLGEVLIYNPHYYFAQPTEIIRIWDGGMSFHGGFIGMLLAMALFARRNHIPILSMFDVISAGVPIGLGLVRIGNFINAELLGRVSDVPWAVLFPNGGVDEAGNLLARHPSQLYEAALEGFVLFLVLMLLCWRTKSLQKPGLIAGIFTGGYGLARTVVEFYREPSVDFVVGDWLTMGMAWSLPMIVGGIWLVIFALLKSKRHGIA